MDSVEAMVGHFMDDPLLSYDLYNLIFCLWINSQVT